MHYWFSNKDYCYYYYYIIIRKLVNADPELEVNQTITFSFTQTYFAAFFSVYGDY